MGECNVCGFQGKTVEAVGDSQIIDVCERCAFHHKMPVIQKPNSDQLRDMSRFQSVKERLSKQAGIDSKKHANREIDKELEKLVVENVRTDYSDLVDNFHWVIQQGRRSKKISTKQLSELIAEPEILIQTAEKGKLPENYKKLVGKLEQFLNIKLFKEDRKPAIPNELNIRDIDLDEVTIGDLKEMHEEKFADESKMKRKSILDDVASKLDEKKKKSFWDRFKKKPERDISDEADEE